jgi:hypothetical protein
MLRIALACCFGALLVACVTPSAQQTDWMQARRACADVGIDPGSSAFEQCVFDHCGTSSTWPSADGESGSSVWLSPAANPSGDEKSALKLL